MSPEHHVLMLEQRNDVPSSVTTIEASEQDGMTVIRITAQSVHTQEEADAFGAALEAHLRPGAHCVISFEGVTRFSTSAMSRLITFQKELKRNGGTLRLCDVPPGIRSAFTIIQLDRVFDIEATIEAARQELRDRIPVPSNPEHRTRTQEPDPALMYRMKRTDAIMLACFGPGSEGSLRRAYALRKIMKQPLTDEDLRKLYEDASTSAAVLLGQEVTRQEVDEELNRSTIEEAKQYMAPTTNVID